MCLAGEISRNEKYNVTIYASKPEMFLNQITVEDYENGTCYLSGKITATYDIKTAILGADVILCTFPAQLRENIIKKMSEYIKPDAYLGFLPGYGGAEFFCNDLIERGVSIFALQKAPYVARTKDRGKIAGLMSRKKVLYIGSIPMSKCCYIAGIVEEMLSIKCETLPNYMAATLLPGNPLLHTSGSYVYLKDYKKGTVFPEQIYYYQSWNDECSRVICKFSDEMMEICGRLPLDLAGVQSIQEYYESSTPEKLTKKFHSIPSFQPLTFPMKRMSDGYVPDFSSRFYTEDIPFGVCILKALAMIVGVTVPTIDEILAWYYRMVDKEYFKPDGNFGKDIAETAVPQRFGMNSEKDICDFYLR